MPRVSGGVEQARSKAWGSLAPSVGIETAPELEVPQGGEMNQRSRQSLRPLGGDLVAAAEEEGEEERSGRGQSKR